MPCNSYDMTSPTCFDYQFRSTDTPANMTLGVIFGNPPANWPKDPWTGSWGCYPAYGDCMVCSDSHFDDNPLDLIYPKIPYVTYPCSYACERENVPDTEIVDGKTNFEYRQEVCGDSPKPDNTNILIKGLEAESTDEFYFGCNIYASERYVGKMSNILNTKRMPCKYQYSSIHNLYRMQYFQKAQKSHYGNTKHMLILTLVLCIKLWIFYICTSHMYIYNTYLYT